MHGSHTKGSAMEKCFPGESGQREVHDTLSEGIDRMKDLNDRFAKYIDNAIFPLQRKNRELQEELQLAEKEEYNKSSAIYKRVQCDFKLRLDDHQKEVNAFKAEKEKFKKCFEKECHQRKECEKDLEELRKKYDETSSTLDKLQRKIKLMEANLTQLQDVRERERNYWKHKVDHIQNLESIDTFKADLEQSLREIRNEYEEIAKKNKEQIERYKQKFEEQNSSTLQKVKKENECYRKEMNELKLKDELQINTVHEKDREIAKQKEASKCLEKKIVNYTNEYQELHNVKARIEQEMATYKNLLSQVEKKARDYSSQPCTPETEDDSYDEDDDDDDDDDICRNTEGLDDEVRIED
ncbi:glial fibrillary acidic protein-like [Callorhinchus milii]|uniref:glial fibrillary acidic protein-like n=1 Tax=Callorhinchus milii TaxID=7868 RepID=UPI0004574422|nr:glial fibrillary acidic protein-like [Callorhinchus milii]|eukprot:gi/632982752/ref/XP_007908309.1/ PREDICTED: glial fibrillary acidic protein-like [Callorhinchus milii]